MSSFDDRPLESIPELLKLGYQEGVQFLNKMSQDGLINLDFGLDKDGKGLQKVVANGLEKYNDLILFVKVII